jgi:hypothetical protein
MTQNNSNSLQIPGLIKFLRSSEATTLLAFFKDLENNVKTPFILRNQTKKNKIQIQTPLISYASK